MTDLGQLLTGLAGMADASEAPRLVGVGWATVDIERTAAGISSFEIRPTDQDELLGARAWRTDQGLVALVLLEPITEGRLAAALARRGEGIVALYLAAAESLAGEPLAGEPLAGATPVGPLRPTALGLPGRLMPLAHPWGPFIIEVSPRPSSSSAPDGASTPSRAGHPP